MKTNGQLYEDVTKRLNFEPGIDLSLLTFSVHDGIVTLAGAVNTYLEKKHAEMAVKEIQGVSGVVNEIKVTPVGDNNKNDADLAQAVLLSLQIDPKVPDQEIQVVVDHGRVTLTGEVETQAQRKSAERAVLKLVEAAAINNHIKVRTPIESQAILNEIRRKFAESADANARRIKVKTKGSKAILEGTVQSWTHISDAVQAAWAVPGVTEVENHLVLDSNC